MSKLKTDLADSTKKRILHCNSKIIKHYMYTPTQQNTYYMLTWKVEMLIDFWNTYIIYSNHEN